MIKMQMQRALPVLIVTTALLSGCATSTPAAGEMVVPVKVYQSQEGILGHGSQYTGTITPAETVNIVPKISGRVAALQVDVGSEVKKGQVLFTLEDQDLRNNVAKAEAAATAAAAGVETATVSHESSMAQAQSGVVQSKSGVIQSRNGLSQASNAVTQAESAVKQSTNGVTTAKNAVKQTQQALEDSQRNLSRIKALFEEGAATKSQLEQAQTSLTAAETAHSNAENALANAEQQHIAAQKALETARQAYANANSSLSNASSGYGNAEHQLEVSRSTAAITASQESLKQAQINKDIAQNALKDSVITSPINGVVGARNMETGEMVSPQAAALVVTNLSKVNTLIYVPSEDINQIKPGDRVQVRATAFDYVTSGTVKTISPLSQNGKGYPVKIEVDNADMSFKAGMLAAVSFADHDAESGILVPSSAVQHVDEHDYVYVAEEGAAVRKEVKIGQTAGSQTLLTGGIGKGESVITNKLALLEEHTPIRVSQ